MKAKVKFILNFITDLSWKFQRYSNIDELVTKHFNKWSSIDHQNINGLKIALKNIRGRNPVLLETGTSAWGTDSSRLFDSYVRKFGGRFYSVDINEAPSKRLRHAKSRRTRFYVMDSVEFITKFTVITGLNEVNFIYLDSWDVDWRNPLPSAKHGYEEIMAAKRYFRTGTILVIDDTPRELKWIPKEFHNYVENFIQDFMTIPGKGSFYTKALEGLDYEVLYHEYNLVILFK